jgi:hypothetical protein
LVNFAGCVELVAFAEADGMGRTYAGVLGTLAFTTTVVRGLLHGGGFQSTMTSAMACLVGFAAIGAVIGELAAWIVADSIRSTLASETIAEPEIRNS